MKRAIVLMGFLGLMLGLCSGAAGNGVTAWTFEQEGATVETGDPDYPYRFDYVLTITSLDPADAPITDFEWRWPNYQEGWLRVTPPEGWVGEEYIGADEFGWNFVAGEADYMNEAGSLGGWSIEGKFPGKTSDAQLYLTKFGEPVGPVSYPSMPLLPEPATMGLVALGIGGLLLERRRR